MQRDEQIFELIQAEKERQLNGIELIASENFVSQQVMDAAGSVKISVISDPNDTLRR